MRKEISEVHPPVSGLRPQIKDETKEDINTKPQGVGISKDHRGVGIGAKPVQLKSKRIRA